MERIAELATRSGALCGDKPAAFLTAPQSQKEGTGCGDAPTAWQSDNKSWQDKGRPAPLVARGLSFVIFRAQLWHFYHFCCAHPWHFSHVVTRVMEHHPLCFWLRELTATVARVLKRFLLPPLSHYKLQELCSRR